MIHINTIPGQAMKKKGYARYPEDYPHLTHGAKFAAWRSGDDWEIETTLDGQALEKQWDSFCKLCEHGLRMWEVKYRNRNGKVDFLWYGNSVDEAEAKRRNQDMEASGMEILCMRPVNKLPTNMMYIEMVKQENAETANQNSRRFTDERNQE